MKKLSVIYSVLAVMILASCSHNRSPISGIADAIDDYVSFSTGDVDWEELDKKSVSEKRKFLSNSSTTKEDLKAAIEAEASKLDGTTISVANDEISEIEPLRLTLVENGSQPRFRLNGKFKIEKDIELDVSGEYHAEKLKNGALARVDLASPKVEEENVHDSFTYSPLAFVSVIPVSVENGVIIAKAGTIIDIVNAEWYFRTDSRHYRDIYKQASEIWLQPIGLAARRSEDGRISL